MVISITSAEYIRGYEIKLSFSDGVEKVIDFSGFVEFCNPSIEVEKLAKLPVK